MARLIDADALIELIQKDIEKTASFMNTAEKYDGSFEKLYGQLNTLKNYKSIISDLPTTYDVEKVVAELETKDELIKVLSTKLLQTEFGICYMCKNPMKNITLDGTNNGCDGQCNTLEKYTVDDFLKKIIFELEVRKGGVE